MIIRTGEASPYYSIILSSGVTFQDKLQEQYSKSKKPPYTEVAFFLE